MSIDLVEKILTLAIMILRSTVQHKNALVALPRRLWVRAAVPVTQSGACS